VCGASRGLGRAVTLELARRGVRRIAICARTGEDLQPLANRLRAQGITVLAEARDLSDDVQAQQFIESAATLLGPIDVLVTNAATMLVAPVATLTTGDFEEAHASTFKTALHPILAVLPAMRARRRGTIAVVTSIGARVGVPHLAPYSAAKFATMGFAESLRGEVANDGVNVLTVVPGLMRTGSHVHAEVKGDHDLEYSWFGAGAMAPLLSIDADRAARYIVSAIARGDVELAFTPEARIAPILRAIAPGVWAELLALTSRLLLPRAPVGSMQASRRREGAEIERTSRSPLVHAVRDAGTDLKRRHAQN
jgi:NAD(P)-dependent dehydrogenase (short-subunit alcohol dehydrogenase family)